MSKEVRSCLKVVGYVLISALISDPVIDGVEQLLQVNIPDVVIYGLVNTILRAVAVEIRRRLPEDHTIHKVI